MKSPRNPLVEMQPLVYQGIELDRCPASGGVWFDAHELYELTQKMSRNDSFGQEFGGDWTDFGDQAAEAPCPRGHGRLEPFKVAKNGADGEITLDVCRKCFGIWVDGAELTLLREVTLHNRETGGPPTIEPIHKNQLANAVSWLNPMTWINKLR